MSVFIDIPAPASNGAGAAVDTSGMAASKTVIVGGAFNATVTIEYSTAPAGNLWAPIQSFQGPGRAVVDLAARRLRAVTSSYVSGTPNADVGAPAATALFVQLGAVAVDISALPAFKTVVTSGQCIVELSEDNVTFSQVFAFQGAGGQSAVITGQFARVTGGSPTVWIGGADVGIDTGGGAVPSNTPPLPITDSTNLAGVAADVSRSDHQHSHGARGGGSLHALFTASSAGFMQMNVVTPDPVRALDVVFQPSATRPTLVIYSVDVTCQLNGPAGAGGAIQLLSDSVNPPTTIRCEMFLLTGGSIDPAEQVFNIIESVLVYVVPAGDFVSLTTVPTAGGPTFRSDFATEITL